MHRKTAALRHQAGKGSTRLNIKYDRVRSDALRGPTLSVPVLEMHIDGGGGLHEGRADGDGHGRVNGGSPFRRFGHHTMHPYDNPTTS